MIKKLYTILISLILMSCFHSCKETSDEDITDRDLEEEPQSPPNIIFLLTDDQRFDALSYAGNTVINTPNMDALAKGGVYFKNAYVTTSICAMSRASILTGQYARRHDIWDFGESLTTEQYENTYPAVLKRAGYTTGFVGKFGVGNISDSTANLYFDYWEGFNGQGRYETDYEGQPIHLTEKMGNHALEFLDSVVQEDKPFLLSMSFKAPHVQDGNPESFIPDEAYAQLYESATIEKPKAADEQYFDYFPEEFIQNSNGAINVARKRWNHRFPNSEKFQESIKKYYRLVHGVDVVIGRIREQLEELGVADNTVIVLASDNGFYFGEYGFAGKWYGSDPSIRIPIIIYDPRPETPKGLTINNMALNIDLAPTMLSIAGAEVPERMQGSDLYRLIKGQTANWRTEFLYEHLWPSSDAYYIPSTEGVVTEDYKYMKYFLNRQADNVMFEELYDRRVDVNELSNLIDNQSFSQILNDMKGKLSEMREEAR